MSKKLKVLFVSAEVSPLAKVGGLADVAGALPKALTSMGHDVRIVMPGYKMIEDNPNYQIKTKVKDLQVPLGGRMVSGSVKQTALGDVPVYLISAPYFEEYVDSRSVYVPGSEPYAFFSRAVLEMLSTMKPAWKPDVIHCNDWHTGMLPVYKSVLYSHDAAISRAAGVFTVHNLAYQGEFDYTVLDESGLPGWLYTMDKLECYGRVNFLKAGMVFSDLVSTVSPTYACEIQTDEYGCRLQGLLAYMNDLGRLKGILNGIDYDEFDPACDGRICSNYCHADTRGKTKNKRALQKAMGLPFAPEVPVIGLVSRLADQKGLDLIYGSASKLMKLGLQLVVLGTGDQRYEEFFSELERKYPEQVKANIGFDMKLAQQIYAGSDMFLMPSRFEPCGLGQLISLRYGTIPIVRKTGGLADTIVDHSAKNPDSNGFVFTDYTPAALMKAVRRAVETFGDKKEWKRIVSTALCSDYSWSAQAEKYVDLYHEAMEIHKSQPVTAYINDVRQAA
jgi:starch synthase